MKIARTQRFKKAWTRLTKREKSQARKAVTNLALDMRYPSLMVKKMGGVEGIWEARVSLSLRITFQIEGNIIVLRNIGRHDEALERP
ncbi:MAG: hypothetical protein HYX90_11415 [Chloroflexi bacterium]|nr:hypothetical protein [Chloroflexota bacterium]